MAAHIISRRIQYIIQYVHDYDYPSKQEIIQFLNEKDFNLSSRTIERDFERIRTDFGLEITYSKANQGYFLDKDKSIKVDSFFKFLEIVSVADIFSESLQNSNKILDYVSFDDSKNFKGIQNLREILLAISQNRKVEFIHENFFAGTFKEYSISPFLLKEFENRWYVVGVPDGMDEIRTFGVDRITQLKIGKTTKLKKKHFEDQVQKFQNIIGLNFSNQEPVDIRLRVDGVHVKYMRSLPLHHSQLIHSENEHGQFFVDFYLSPNYEFMTQILKIGDEVEVIYPESLRQEVKGVLRRANEKYN